ncbi:lamin-like protein isoform X2 [Medicago truncatula]|uniref:lamin-like protein isoform X2 n=1 Tax=Medicago truncatula TaxID=3880 RepID=UPI0019685219|nr:lamin-like protein isoform X2 [Medicago truncatula]
MEVFRFNKTMLLMMIMTAMMWNMAKAEEHFVGGGKQRWIPGNNLTKWSLNEHFRVNDWLFFGYGEEYQKYLYHVLEVNKTSYENCIDTGFIKNITRGGGRDVFLLTEAKTYYFISGGGFCQRGVKVAIDVNEHVAPAPQPTPHKGSNASNI